MSNTNGFYKNRIKLMSEANWVLRDSRKIDFFLSFQKEYK